jgi:hypothetical protein
MARSKLHFAPAVPVQRDPPSGAIHHQFNDFPCGEPAGARFFGAASQLPQS